MNQDLISVIIPMYKMEKFIAKCLESVCASSYKNLEILCVDDGSPDASAEIASSYAKKDARIHIVKNAKNLGLFRARVEGMKVAKGEYIAFVDADDFVSIDWFRLLHKKAVEENADMVLGNTVNVFENGSYNYYNNYRSLTKSHATIQHKDLLDTFFSQEGSCFVWHTIWNKLYKKSLIDRCMPYFQKIDYRLIMGEDIAFSSVLYTHANNLAFADADAYFYYRHSEASTSATLPLESIIKNIKDLKGVFDFLESSLKEYDEAEYNKHFNQIVSFKNRYHRIWSGNVYNKNAQHDKEALNALEYTFGKRELILPAPHEFYFYELTTPWSNRYENIKKQIAQDDVKVVSFDIFDTLIVRDFYSPDDIFYLVGKFASKIIPYISEKRFFEMRKDAEAFARKQLQQNTPMFEDITLTEIYESLVKMFKLNPADANKIMAEEIRLEMKFCHARSSTKELFEFAKCFNKKIVIVSDMYLEKSTVEDLLKNNGYEGYDKLYLSSDQRLLKASGKLFKKLIKDEKCKPNAILHLGDNWSTDILVAKSKGIRPIFIPKTVETFENRISDIFTGELIAPFTKKGCSTIDATNSLKEFPIRTMVGNVANTLFDNPFNPYQAKSNFNGDSYLTGYYVLGMHLFGVAKWILDVSQQNGYKKIVFLARDGYILKQIFDHLCSQLNINIETDYFHASRRALLPYSITCESDLYKISEFIDVYQHSPLDILTYCSVIFNPLTEELKNKYFENGIILDKKFNSRIDFYTFIEVLKQLSFNEDLCKEKLGEAKHAFSKIFTEQTATFDIGYSGRLQSIICDLAEKSIDTFFIHANGYNTTNSLKHPFKIHTFYDFTPSISGIVREFMISEPTNSCIGYKFEQGNIRPIFEDKNLPYEATYAIKEFQKGALHFCQHFINTFADELKDFSFRPIDCSAPFEYYLLNASEFDRYTFSSALVEDNVYAGYEAKGIFDIWTWHVSSFERKTDNMPAYNSSNMSVAVQDYLSKYSKFKKALFYFIFDRKTFKEKLKNKMRRKKNRR